MKLLNKSDVVRNKGLERQQAMAEGRKLAKRVDSLREVSAAEEASLAKFRVKTLETIQKDIDVKAAKLNALALEVKDLEERREIVLVPLDAHAEFLDIREKEVASREAKVAVWESRVDVRDRALDSREYDIGKLEKKTALVHTQAHDALDEARTIKANAVDQEQKANTLFRTTTVKLGIEVKAAEERERWVFAREQAVAVTEENHRKEKIKLAQGWTELNDRIELLERDIKRAKK